MVLCFGTNACISRIKDGKVGLSAVGAAYKANLVLMSDSRIAELFEQLRKSGAYSRHRFY